MPRPCLSFHSPSPETCRLCWLDQNDPRYHEWSISAGRAPCLDLGDVLTPPELASRGLDVSTCGCARRIRKCDTHDVCTTGEPRDGIACCATCPDYTV